MRVLVTGGCGFIGQHLCAQLVEMGAEVTVYDALTRAARQEVLGAEVVRGDVRDGVTVRLLLGRVQPDIVYHLAAESHVDASLLAPADCMAVNGVGTSVVAHACADAEIPLLHVSTDEVYGDAADARAERAPGWADDGATEDAPMRPSSPYSASKAAGDAAVFAAARCAGLRAAIVRPSNCFGPGQLPEKLIPRACALLHRGAPVPLHGGGHQVRQWIHVEEAARGMVLVASALADGAFPVARRPTVFNLAGPQRTTVRAVVGSLMSAHGTGEMVGTSDRPGQDMDYHVSGRAASERLGFRPERRICSRQEVDQLLAAYRDAQPIAPAWAEEVA